MIGSHAHTHTATKMLGVQFALDMVSSFAPIGTESKHVQTTCSDALSDCVALTRMVEKSSFIIHTSSKQQCAENTGEIDALDPLSVPSFIRDVSNDQRWSIMSTTMSLSQSRTYLSHGPATFWHCQCLQTTRLSETLSLLALNRMTVRCPT